MKRIELKIVPAGAPPPQLEQRYHLLFLPHGCCIRFIEDTPVISYMSILVYNPRALLGYFL